MALEHKRTLDAIAAEIARMSEVLTGADMSKPVPSCPGWDLAELARHTGRVHRWVGHLVTTRATGFLRWQDIGLDVPTDDESLAGWLAAGADQLVAVLSVDPTTEVWTFAPDNSVGWWARRMLHESVVHRCDAELTLGVEPVVETEIAVDGIDELLCTLLPRSGAPDKLAGSGRGGQSLHFHTTDGAGEWTIRLTDEGFSVAGEHEKSTVAVRGTAADLLLLVWNRRRPSEARFECFGDTALIDTWLSATTI